MLIELEPPGTGLWRGRAQLHHPALSPVGPWFDWARVSLDSLDELATSAEFTVHTRHHGTRCFADLRHSTGQNSVEQTHTTHDG